MELKIGNLEIVSNLFNLISVFLARKNNIHTWWTGILGCVLFGLLFYESKLYADSILQIFFIITSIAGWINWKKGDLATDELPITRVNPKKLFITIFISAILTTTHGYLLHRYTDASYPFVDSAILMLSITAQFLLMERKLENWYFWILVNLIAVPLYYLKDLKLTSAIYLLFLFNAIWALISWKKILKQNEKI